MICVKLTGHCRPRTASMDPTFTYDLALFLHVVGVFGLFAALTVEGIALRGIRAAVTGD